METIGKVAGTLVLVGLIGLLVASCCASVIQDQRDTRTCLSAGYSGWLSWNGTKYCVRMGETAPELIPVSTFQELE